MLKLAAQQGLIFFFFIAFLISGCELFGNKQKKEEEIERSYTKSIERNYSNEFERALIDSAEAAYPPRDSVIFILDLVYPGRDNESIIPKSKYWHMASLDGVLQPYMITKDAISYYSALIDSLNSGSAKHIKEARFGYQSTISFYEEFTFEWSEHLLETIEEITGYKLNPSQHFEQVYVVKMELGWSHEYIEHIQGGFSRKRIVILNESGNVIRIFMDGPWWPAIAS